MKKTPASKQTDNNVDALFPKPHLPQTYGIAIGDSKHELDIIPVSQIVFASAAGSYSTIVYRVGDSIKKILISRRINFLEKILSRFGFYRCHRSFLINQDRIKKIINPSYTVEMDNGSLLDFSKNHAAEMNSLFLTLHAA